HVLIEARDVDLDPNRGARGRGGQRKQGAQQPRTHGSRLLPGWTRWTIGFALELEHSSLEFPVVAAGGEPLAVRRPELAGVRVGRRSLDQGAAFVRDDLEGARVGLTLGEGVELGDRGLVVTGSAEARDLGEAV